MVGVSCVPTTVHLVHLLITALYVHLASLLVAMVVALDHVPMTTNTSMEMVTVRTAHPHADHASDQLPTAHPVLVDSPSIAHPTHALKLVVDKEENAIVPPVIAQTVLILPTAMNATLDTS
jgi:hypothetical protein